MLVYIIIHNGWNLACRLMMGRIRQSAGEENGARSITLHGSSLISLYKKKIMLNPTEHEISTSHKTKIATNKEVYCFNFTDGMLYLSC